MSNFPRKLTGKSISEKMKNTLNKFALFSFDDDVALVLTISVSHSVFKTGPVIFGSRFNMVRPGQIWFNNLD